MFIYKSVRYDSVVRLKSANFNIIFLLLFFGSMTAQKEAEVKPYTIQTTYEKLHKDYPFIVPIEPLNSNKIESKENVVYREIDNITLKADIYKPAGNSSVKYPAVLLIHGGGWITGSKENERVMAQHLAANGYVAVTAAYRLSPVATYPAAVLDLKAAICWMRKNADKYQIDADKIAVLGASAGAQLATLIGVTIRNQLYKEGDSNCSDAVQAIVNIDGIVSFIHPESQEGTVAGKWLGGLKDANFEKWKEASPLEYASAKTPPTLFINSAQPRFHAGRDDMIKILDSYGIYNETHTIPDSPHSFWLMHPWFEKTLQYTLSFLDKNFKN